MDLAIAMVLITRLSNTLTPAAKILSAALRALKNAPMIPLVPTAIRPFLEQYTRNARWLKARVLVITNLTTTVQATLARCPATSDINNKDWLTCRSQ